MARNQFEDEFTVHVISSASMQIFKSNTLASFRNFFNDEIQLSTTLALQQRLRAQARHFSQHSVEIKFLGYLELERQAKKHPILQCFQRQTLNHQKHQFQRAMEKIRLSLQTIWRRQNMHST